MAGEISILFIGTANPKVIPNGNAPLSQGELPRKYSLPGTLRWINAHAQNIFPFGNMIINDAETLGEAIRANRKRLKVTQKELALASGTGLRFIIELEQGKPTCQVGKAFGILQALGMRLELVES